ncbi:hypothetical protein Lalb_Chr21g0314891 [Lupinus albus]|uniref:Uncharacterized protein n=1 Tax=Lupinus albus TaxID=3870 RepID=A0A6A4NRJ7_LUPAL|nr:hypothetical protein Lalb_Chr21g0314891 [Lupinus albus]
MLHTHHSHLQFIMFSLFFTFTNPIHNSSSFFSYYSSSFSFLHFSSLFERCSFWFIFTQKNNRCKISLIVLHLKDGVIVSILIFI